MSLDMETLPAEFTGHLKRLQALAGHEAHSYRLARGLQMRVRVGLYTIPEAEPDPVIVLQPWWYGGNNDVTRHEIAHVMLWWSGLESHILAEYGAEDGWKVVEHLCNQAVAFLQITPPMVTEAVRRFGVSARAVRHLQKLSGARVEVALRRLIYDDPHAERAGFLTSGKYIAEVAMCNHGLPFGWLDRVPEPALKFRGEAKVSLLRLPGGTRLVGVCGG